MGLRVAVASGNWSNPATWYLGVKPTVGDIVASNGFTVTIDENVNVDSLTNAAQSPVSNTIPLMTSNTTPSGVASSNSIFASPTYDAYKAFDQSTADNTRHWLSVNNAVNPWLEYQFPTAKIIVGYSIVATYSSVPNSWQFQAWDGNTWVTLDSVTGRTSNALLIRTFTNTTSYTRYRIYVTVLNGTNACIGELAMFDNIVDAQQSVAGGGFVASSTVTITCTSSTGITGGSTTTPLTVSASSPAVVTVNSNLTHVPVDNSRCIAKTGNCTLNITGNTLFYSSGASRNCLEISALGTTNFIGNVRGVWSGSNGIKLIAGSAGAILNITGNINPDKSLGTAQNLTCIVVQTVCTINITGNIYGDYGNSNAISLTAAATLYVTGSIYGGNSAGSFGNGAAINTNGQAAYINIVGSIYAQHTVLNSATALTSTSTSAINLCTGPFICSPEGFYPLAVSRMHLIPSVGTYIEFRDETTNGALSPLPVAPATQMISPVSASDTPIPGDVRYGTTYAFGTRTGTLRMPTAAQVVTGLPVDNTFGTAIFNLSASTIWDYPTSSMTTVGSIGERLKNISTPQTTGEQLEAFLKPD